jgi:hypothetical protein
MARSGLRRHLLHGAALLGALLAACDDDAGRRRVTPLAEGWGLAGLAVDGSDVFWTDFPAGTVSRVPKAGGAATTLASGSSSDPSDLVVRDGAAYWVGANSATVTKVSTSGGTPVTLASGTVVGWRGLAVDATHVYWMMSGELGPGIGAVMRVPRDGGAPETLHADAFYPGELAVDETSVYFTMLDGFGLTTGQVVKVPKSGGAAVTLASDQECPYAIAVDALAVYWTNSGTGCYFGYPVPTNGAVMKVAKDGGSPLALAPEQPAPGGLALDDTHVYWTTRGSGERSGAVVKAAKDGTSRTTLVPGQPLPAAIAVDESDVFWVASGSIFKAPKN